MKSGQTIQSDWFSAFETFANARGGKSRDGVVVYGGNEIQRRTRGTVCGIWDLPTILGSI